MRALPMTLLIVACAIARSAAGQTEVSAHVRSENTIQPADEFNAAVTFGMKYFAVGDYPSALDQFTAAAAVQPNHPAVIYDTAVVLFKLARFAEAQATIDTYQKLYPSGAESERVKALQLDLEFERMRQKKQQENQSYLELFNRARFTYEKGDHEGALSQFAKAAEQRPSDAAVAYNQAIIYEASGDYRKAVERLRHYLAIQTEAADKAATDQRIFALQSEIDDAASMIVCAFCGAKLPRATQWCPHCWHGPYEVDSALRNTRPCIPGASATRTALYTGNRVSQNEDLPCNLANGSYAETLRYSRARQRAIEDARKGEGWTYSNELLQSYRDAEGNEIRLVHGADSLQQMFTSAGDALSFAGHKDGDAWLLDSEEFVIDGQKYVKQYAYDATKRITREIVQYQNQQACGHLITSTANYVRSGDRLTSVIFDGGYRGFALEGEPTAKWQSTLRLTYDEQGRVTKHDLMVDSMTKTWARRPNGFLRSQTEAMLPAMRVKKPLDMLRTGDVCGTVGNRQVGNALDLRPFTSISADLPSLLPFGVVQVTSNYVYP